MTPGVRLRPAPTPAELADMYPAPHQHAHFGAGHDLRVRVSIALGSWLAAGCESPVVADLSCGDGAIASGILPRRPGLVMGDLAAGWPVCGPIERTVAGLDQVDVFVCTETLEHISDPFGALVEIREKARHLLVSFPHRPDLDDNPEHLWQWTVDEAEQLLVDAGWAPLTCAVLSVPDGPYTYSIWGCSCGF